MIMIHSLPTYPSALDAAQTSIQRNPPARAQQALMPPRAALLSLAGCRTSPDVPRDRLVGSNEKDAVLDGDRRPFARLAQSSGGFLDASLEFHVVTSCSTSCMRSHWDWLTLKV